MCIRDRAEVATDESKGKDTIIIHEIPYQLNKARLLERIAELVKEKKIEGITELRDESDKDGIRVVVETKRDVVPEVILNQLYQFTQLQDTFGIILLALVDGVPKVMSLKTTLQHFVDFRHGVVVRRTEFELKEAEARAHILEGLKIALDNIDEVLEWADAINVLRIQRERMGIGLIPSVREYREVFGITSKRIENLKKEIVIMHPGPINRGVELDGDIADSDNSIILNQVLKKKLEECC